MKKNRSDPPPRRARMTIRHPEAAGPNEETRVPCPACGKGMVSPSLAVKLKAVLPKPGEEIPQVVTETLPVLPILPEDNEED